MKRILIVAAALFYVTAASASPAAQSRQHPPAQARAEATLVYVAHPHTPPRAHYTDPTAAPFNNDGCKGTVPFPACTGGN
jgi:hypothetical protein